MALDLVRSTEKAGSLAPPPWSSKVAESMYKYLQTPLEFFFQEQSYSSLHSGRSLAWDHVRGDTDDPCGAIADFCGVVADFCAVFADPCGAVTIGGRRCDDAVRCATC